LACLGELGLGACLADDMGLGKTVQVIAHLLDRAERSPGSPSLVLCPTSVLGNWSRELARFAPSLRVAQHHGAGRSLDDARHADVVLTTYGLLVRDAAALQGVGWDVVVLDEAQAIKNPDSRRARAACGLTARHRVALSGTPVENRLDELWSLMRFLVPGLLGSRAHFQRTVAVPVERMGDEDAARRLRLGTSPFLLRRVKSDPTVVSDLPDKVQRKVWCALAPAQASLYHRVAEEKLSEVSEADGVSRRGRVLAMLTALKQVCNHPAHYLRDGDGAVARSGKLRRTVELLEAVLAADERALVFTQYREMGELLSTALTPIVGQRPAFLHGGLSVAERDELVRRFQEDDDAAPVLIISLRAGGVGLNLTRATHVLHYDRWWNPAVEDQATDRAYRIGQRRNVLVHKLVCQGTLEERIDAMLEDKRGLAEAVVGSGEGLVAELDDAALRALVLLGEDAVVEDE
jgi:SNF2 family DNA or RNA helicase